MGNADRGAIRKGNVCQEGIKQVEISIVTVGKGVAEKDVCQITTADLKKNRERIRRSRKPEQKKLEGRKSCWRLTGEKKIRRNGPWKRRESEKETVRNSKFQKGMLDLLKGGWFGTLQ